MLSAGKERRKPTPTFMCLQPQTESCVKNLQLWLPEGLNLILQLLPSFKWNVEAENRLFWKHTQKFYQPANNAHSLHVEDGLLTYVCILFYYIKLSNQLCSLRRGDTSRAKRRHRAEGERPTEGHDGGTRRRTFFQDGLQFHSFSVWKCLSHSRQPVHHLATAAEQGP